LGVAGETSATGRIWLAAAFCAALCACGGGGGNSTSPPPGGGGGVNHPPAFTSAAAVNVQSGSAGVFYIATATDPDGDALTYSISSGADAARFSITGSGALSFVTPPNFAAPADADHNNVYQVSLAVSDGQASVTLALAVTVTNGATALKAHRVGTGFNQPLFVAGLVDGSGRVYVVEKPGLIEILNPADGTVAPFLDVRSQVSTDVERGLLGFALAPDFGTSLRFYVYLTNTSGDIEVRRYLVTSGNHDVVDMTSAQVLLTIAHSAWNFHNGGWIGFDKNGLLYAAVGDPAQVNAQNTSSLLGKILRIDVSGNGAGYAVPPGNPYGNAVWAIGLRNPFRDGFDPVTGDLFIGDVGENSYEEIDRLHLTDAGANLGWPYFEATHPFSGTPPGGTVFTPPVAEYPHGEGPNSGNTVIGGYVYHGPIAQLQGLYFFGDYFYSNIWTVPETMLVKGTTLDASQFTNRNADLPPDKDDITPTSFGTDAVGNLYVADIGNGDVFRIEAAN
jgi:glucose/arabinose dehydrogenase